MIRIILKKNHFESWKTKTKKVSKQTYIWGHPYKYICLKLLDPGGRKQINFSSKFFFLVFADKVLSAGVFSEVGGNSK